MIYSSINGKPLKELTFEELVAHFRREYFTELLAGGYVKARASVKTMLDTTSQWAVDNGTIQERLSCDEEFLSDVTNNLTDSVITSGSKGLGAAIAANLSHHLSSGEFVTNGTD